MGCHGSACCLGGPTGRVPSHPHFHSVADGISLAGKRLLAALSVLTLIHILSIAAPAQITVTSLGQGNKGVKRTTSVKCIRYATTTEVSEVAVGMSLEINDQLYTTLENVNVQIKCGAKSTFNFFGPFRFLITLSDNTHCAINLLSGRGDVVGDQPTQITSGETILGSKRTRYGMRVVAGEAGGPETGPLGRQRTQELFVYEGEVEVKSPQFQGTLSTGKKITIDRTPREIKDIELKEISTTARLYASIDVNKADIAANGELSNQQREEIYDRFVSLHERVLTDARAFNYRLALSSEQLRFSTTPEERLKYVFITEPLYHLNRAEEIAIPGDSQQQAVVALLKGIAYNRVFKQEEAVDHFQKAAKFDPNILNGKWFNLVQIDESSLRMLKAAVNSTRP